ncbi:hypothetical protein V6N11_079748 [Hibiscus sabdariffa]|uniref:Uncharacterized protein n=1 Tax=Hibiscus sabdariffa TaxID=183260 RepID=A0ABR2RWA6_9ROSI
MENHLCGPPVTKSCITNDGGSSDVQSKVNGFYESMIVGFVMGFWGVVAPLFFIRFWRHSYYQKLEHYGHMKSREDSIDDNILLNADALDCLRGNGIERSEKGSLKDTVVTLSGILAANFGPWYIGGDFNMVLDQLEHVGDNHGSRGVVNFIGGVFTTLFLGFFRGVGARLLACGMHGGGVVVMASSEPYDF